MPTTQPDSVADSLFVPFWQRGLAALLVAFILFGLFWGGAQPAAAGLLQPPVDKLAHLALYALLTWGGWYVLGGSRPILALALPALIGLMDELHQGGLPGRIRGVFQPHHVGAGFIVAYVSEVDQLVGCQLSFTGG